MDDAAGREPADVSAAQVTPRENEPEDVRPRAGQIPIHEERRAETCTMRTRGPPRLRPETLRFRDRFDGLHYAAALVALTFPVQAQEKAPMPNRMFASAADVEKLIAKARAEHKGGNTMEIIANVGAFPWQINYRTGNTPASIHKHEMELIEVLETCGDAMPE